jgi:N-methylhydantoinase B
VDPGGPNQRHLEGLVDGEPILAGTLVRIDTTGGGGWGDPLEREPELVAFDVTQGKVSIESARDDYGVVLTQNDDGAFEVDAPSTTALRDKLHSSRGFVPFFDRGPGYRQLSGRDYAEVDVF